MITDQDFDEWCKEFMAIHGMSSVILSDDDTAEMLIEIGANFGLE